jgi:hypothetical protein
MTLYAFISSGLRGAYMPDSCHMVQFKTRRELRQYIESEAQHMLDAYGHGGDKKTIQSICAYAWRNRKKAGLITWQFRSEERAQKQIDRSGFLLVMQRAGNISNLSNLNGSIEP